jgi:nucleotide-binding universal stress UspA family protein
MLTLIGVVPPLPTFAYAYGGGQDELRRDAERSVAALLREAAATLPDDVLVRTVQRSGKPGDQIVRQLADGGHDLVVLGTRCRGRATANLLGSVNAYVHFHTRVPMLVVPPGEETEPPLTAARLTAA